MQFDEFITRVQERARLDSREEATALTRAVLETVGERLDSKVRNGLEAQLPNELKEFLRIRAAEGRRYDLDEFYSRVGARAGLQSEDARERTRQVISVLRQAVPGGEIEDILEDLPPEYGNLFV
jgi:uncharacterized protein (DUF2267 family)